MGNNTGKDLGSIQNFKKELEEKMEPVSIYPPPNAKVIQSQSRRPTKPVSSQHAEKIELDAETIQTIQGKNDKLFYVADGRRQILDTAEWPNSVHGVIAVEVNGMMAWGTGIMIGHRIVLTAGHNLFDFDTQIFHDVETMRFLPGMNGKVLPFGAAKVERYFVSPNYIKHGKQDYGILILKKPVGQMTGYFGLACLDFPEDIKGKRINVTGYPADKVAEKPNTYEMWGMEGEASEVHQETGHISYLIDTGEGQNGSGVWYKEGGEYYVCGVHRGAQFVDQATLLTRDIYKQIYAWLQGVGLDESVFRLRERGDKGLSLNLSLVNSKFLPLLITYKLDDLRSFRLCAGKVGDQELRILAQKTSWLNLQKLDLLNISLGEKGAKALALNNSWINLKSVDLSGNNIGTEGAKALAQNTSWVNLSVLMLYDNNLGSEGASALAQNNSWVNLSELSLVKNGISTEGGEALAQNKSWSNLTCLNLNGNQLGEGAGALGQNTSWVNLSELKLSENAITAEGARGLAQNTSWINLKYLCLQKNQLDGEGARGLAKNTSWVKLSNLDLSNNNLGAEGARGLAQNTSWVKLSLLELSDNNLGGEGGKALGENTSWVNLSRLVLSNNSLVAEGAIGLAQNTSWISLSHLELRGNSIGAEGARGLAKNTSWVNLSQLDLSCHALGIEGAIGLAQNTSWVRLRELNLSKNGIGAEGARELARNTSWISLSVLDLSQNSLTAEGVQGLVQNTSWINLVTLILDRDDFGAKGYEALAQNTSWPKLSLLRLSCDDSGYINSPYPLSLPSRNCSIAVVCYRESLKP